MKQLGSVSEIVAALGGPAAFAAKLQSKRTTVYHWIATDSLPSKTFVVLQSILAAEGFFASPTLWRGMMSPPKSKLFRQ